MAHMIESMFYNREVPWHGLGVKVDGAVTSQDALRLAGLDWKVDQFPLYVGMDSGSAPVEGFVANVRTDTGEVMGVVSNLYKVVQNEEAFAFTDHLIGGEVKYETAGVLTNGRIWMLAQMEGHDIVGDEVIPYLCFTNSFDGKGAIQVVMTPIRIVCNNSLSLALAESNRTWATKHMGSMEAKLDEARRTLKLAHNYMSNLSMEADKLAHKKLSEAKFNEFLEMLFPLHDGMGDRKANNVEILRNELTARYFQAPDLAKFQGTSWGFIQAVTDLVNHTQPRRETATYQSQLFNKILNGHPIVDKAYELVA